LLRTFRQTNAKGIGLEVLIHQQVERQAALHPDALALAFEDESLSYGELNLRANQLAHQLIELGARPDARVALWMERGIDLVVCILATLKAGAAYVPLDPAYPADRLAYMLDDCAPVVVLTQANQLCKMPPTAARVMAIDTGFGMVRNQPVTNPNPAALGLTEQHLAYVIYTSGSTGVPKGVMVPHAGLRNLLNVQVDLFDVRPDSRILQFASPSFDASVLEISMALCHGARLCLAPRKALLPGDPLVRTLLRHGITHLTLPPSALAVLGKDVHFPTVKTLVVAGEVCSPAVARRWAPLHRLVNIYGPTETTVFVTAEVCQAEYSGPTPIGRPIRNVPIYILDGDLRPVAPGARGELFVGGVCVSRGYHNKPELTSQRFVNDPFSPDREARMYKTGDIGRWRPDGSIEYIGRSDFQVKLRGFRIELGEIEARLVACPGVREAVVVCREDAVDDKRLVAYITATEDAEHLSLEPLRARLGRFLPEHMLPAALVRLVRFPLTPNGKIDRASLPVPRIGAFQTASFVAPEGALETGLAEIWQELFQVQTVGRQDNFFALGGHSLLATQLASRVHARMDINLPLRTVFELPELRALAGWLGNKRSSTGGAERKPTRLRRVPRDGPLPCSFSQRRMWLVQQLNPQTTAYNIAFAFRLRGPLNAPGLGQAIDIVAQHYEAFRTRFEDVDGEPMQVIDRHRPVELVLSDLAGLPGGRREDEARRLSSEFTVLPFDLSKAGLHRPMLVRLTESEHVLVWAMHHAICDLWSGGLLLRDVKQVYGALVAGCTPELAPLLFEYADFAAWQRGRNGAAGQLRQLDYWRNKLHNLAPLSLPTDLPRRGPLSGRGGTVHAELSPARVESLKRFSTGHGTTPFMTLLACFQLMLARRSGQYDLAVGVPIANRHRVESEHLVGTLVNTLVMRNDVSGNPSFVELLARVQETALQAFANQDTPFEQLVEHFAAVRDKLHSPLVQVMFNMVNAPFSVANFADLEIEYFAFDQRAAQFDLSLSVDADVFSQVQLVYSTDLFVHATAERMLASFMSLLDQVLHEPQRRVADYSLLASEEQVALRRWNNTTQAIQRELRVDQLIAKSALRNPSCMALQDDRRALTYAELDAQTNHLARELRRRGVHRGARVGLCLERSVAMVVAQLAILKAGAAYVPLDPAYPTERLSYMAQDARLDLIVTESTASASLTVPDWSHDKLLLLDARASDFLVQTSTSLATDTALDARPEDPAYVIYTSGSSGKPKGVVVPHRGLVNFLNSMAHRPGLQASDRMLAVTTLSFDIAVLELLLPLCVGAQVFVASHDEAHDGNALQAKLEACRASVMQATPATWQMLIDAGWQGSPRFKAMIGGEALPPELARQLLMRAGELWNLYGPTETTVWSTCWHVHHPEQGIAIGTPIANTQVHVLDEHRQPCPIGVPGEICIAGDGVALGYFDRPDLSTERFVANAFGTAPAAMLYRTGDRGRWRHDGQLEHLGRSDSQVKLRGHRVELSEIEANLSEHEQVARCIVIVREDQPGDARLVAYIAPQGGMPEVGELRQRLRRKLPEYMVPQHYVLLDAMPLLPNGKIDRSALPKPTAAAVVHDASFWVPRTDAEVALAQIWERLLGIGRVSTTDNFFDLGGHSLLAMRAVSEIHKSLGVRIGARRLVFESLGQLAAGLGGPNDSVRPAAPAKPGTVKYLVGGLQRMLLSRGAREIN
jgi:amino acid adenylation domain-containing protein